MQINLTTAEVIALRDWIADDEVPAPVVLSVGNGHSGFGLYVWTEDYPEEGAVFIKPLLAPAGVAPSPAPQPLPFDPGYVYAYLKAALASVEPDGLTDPQAAYFLEWFEAVGIADGVDVPDGGKR